MSLGEGLEYLEEGVEAKRNTVNTPDSETALQANTCPLLQIRFLEGGGK